MVNENFQRGVWTQDRIYKLREIIPLNTSNNAAVSRKNICDYPLNEVKVLQEQVKHQLYSAKLYSTYIMITVNFLFDHTQCG